VRIERHAGRVGSQEVWKHTSRVVGGEMKFGIYQHEAALRGQKCPVLYWLSGLTCTEPNFITKAAAQRDAAEHGIIVVAPDTSPRGNRGCLYYRAIFRLGAVKPGAGLPYGPV
jgi:S-formylglutathione hydrolase